MPTAVTTRGPADESKASAKAPKETEDFLRKVVKKFNRCETSESKNRQEALDDLRFKKGEQWPEDIKATRTIEKRPCLTINKMPTFCHQITNDQRQNRPAINVSPIGDKGDPETAKMLKGLIKQIERQSNADVAYDTAFDSAVSCGFGYWRIVTEYEDDDTFDQVVRIKRVRNPFRVYMDPDAQDPTGSDANFAFITDMMPREEYDNVYGKSPAPEPWTEGGQGDEYKVWSTETHVRIAEYFCFETDVRTLVALDNGHVGFEDELDSSLQNAPRKDTREVQVKKIKWYKVTCRTILEESEWLGKWIPIVRCIGDETDIEGKVTYAGLIRGAKDSQRMYNFMATAEVENIALTPKAPYIIAEGQLEGYEKKWRQANNKAFPYLEYKPTSVSGHPVPPPQRQQFAGPQAALVQAKISAAQDMQATTGIRFDATLQERNYDESGKALRELKRVGDIGNFHYVDNLARALRHSGEIYVDLLPKILDTPRILTILREDDSEERIKIDPTLGVAHSKQELPDGRIQRLFNPKLGEYEVAVTIGPSFATKRAEAADSMLQFLKVFPAAAQVAGDLIAKNMDWPGADEIAARLMSMLPPNMQNKKLEQLPPEARGMVMSLTKQLQDLKDERDQAVAMLGDKEKDRAIDKEGLANERSKIQSDLETKLAKIQEDFVVKMAAIEAKGKEQGDDGAAHVVALEKIARDFEAKLLKIDADFKIKTAELELKTAQAQEQAKQANEQLKAKEKESREGRKERQADKQGDRDVVGEVEAKVGKRIDKLEKLLDDIARSEIKFIRDPKTNRMTGAKRQRATQ